MSDVRDGHGILLAFDSEESEFARGFEAGRLWTLAREREGEFTEIAHADNAEMLLRIAEATERTITSIDLDDHFIDVTFSA